MCRVSPDASVREREATTFDPSLGTISRRDSAVELPRFERMTSDRHWVPLAPPADATPANEMVFGAGAALPGNDATAKLSVATDQDDARRRHDEVLPIHSSALPWPR